MAINFSPGDHAMYQQRNKPGILVYMKRTMMTSNANPTEYTVYSLADGKGYHVAGCWLQEVEVSDVEMETLGN